MICVFVNEVVIYGIFFKKKVFKDGDILLFDLGVNYKGYYVDFVWIFFVGVILNEVKKLLEVIEEVLWNGLVVIKLGVSVNEIFKVVE